MILILSYMMWLLSRSRRAHMHTHSGFRSKCGRNYVMLLFYSHANWFWKRRMLKIAITNNTKNRQFRIIRHFPRCKKCLAPTLNGGGRASSSCHSDILNIVYYLNIYFHINLIFMNARANFFCSNAFARHWDMVNNVKQTALKGCGSSSNISSSWLAEDLWVWFFTKPNPPEEAQT